MGYLPIAEKSDRKNDLPEVLVISLVLERLADFGKREAVTDDRFDTIGFDCTDHVFLLFF